MILYTQCLEQETDASLLLPDIEYTVFQYLADKPVIAFQGFFFFPCFQLVQSFSDRWELSFKCIMLAMGKVQGNVGIAVLGGIALSLEMEYAPEEFLGYVPGIHVPVAEYAHALLAEHIVQYPLTAFPI